MASEFQSNDPTPHDEPPSVRAVEDLVEPASHGVYWWGWLIFLAAYAAMFFAGGPLRRFALTGLEVLPFLILAVLAYLGDRNSQTRILAFLYWVVLIGVVAVAVLLFSVAALMKPASLDRLMGRGIVPTTDNVADQFMPGGPEQIAWIALWLLVAGVFGLCLYLRPARRTAAGLVPLYADSFVHAVALATIVTLTLVLLIPLMVLGQPPLLEFVNHLSQHKAELELLDPQLAKDSPAASLLEDMSKEDQSFDYIAFLVWLVPSAVLAVGFPFVRTIRESLVRVGLVRPTTVQVAFALVAATALVGIILGVDAGITWLWNTMGWTTTDAKAFENLMKFAINPWGAVMIGVVAGLGEELFVRGVLQPRLGILVSNLFFTAMHALQYNWDALLSVFLIGLILGVIRKKTNTSTSAIVHGAYDFMLLLLAWYTQS